MLAACCLLEAWVRLFSLDRIVVEQMHNHKGAGEYGNRVTVEAPGIGWFLKGYEFNEDGLTIKFPKPHFYPKKKSAGKYRILVLGDSVAEVWVSWNPKEKFPQMLEDSLNLASGKKKFEILNVSVGNYNTAQRYSLLTGYLKDFEFDLLLVQHCFNDAVNNYVHKKEEGDVSIYERYSPAIIGLGIFRDSPLLRSALFRRINMDIYTLFGGLAPEKFSIIGHFEQQQQKELYSLIKGECSRRGAELLVVMFPPLLDRSEPIAHALHMQDTVSADIFRALGIHYMELYSEFREAGFARLYTVPGDFTHPNVLGHRIAAEKLLKVIQTYAH